MKNDWWLYILLCSNGTYYTGITKDVQKRFSAHAAGKGAKYTKSNPPVRILYTKHCGSHSEALIREYAVKRLSKAEKTKLIQTQCDDVGSGE